MSSLFKVFYYTILSRLSSFEFPLGRMFSKWRVLILRLSGAEIGNSVLIGKNVYVGSFKIRVGNNVRINSNVRMPHVELGNDILIARDVIFLNGIHEYRDSSTPVISQPTHKADATVVEDDVWIGARAIIMPGIKLSKGTIIGAGAVVTKNTEPGGIYAGVPAALINTRYGQER